MGSATTSSTAESARRRPTSTSALQITGADRKRQIAQLAEMGVAVPDEYRGEMALAGDWQIVSQKPVELQTQNEQDPSLRVGVRKRKFEGKEDGEEAGETVKKKGWGSTTKEYPSHVQEDLNALLSGSLRGKKEENAVAIKQEDIDQPAPAEQVNHSVPVEQNTAVVADKTKVKQEDGSPLSAIPHPDSTQNEATSPDLEIVFKKRKSKKAIAS